MSSKFLSAIMKSTDKTQACLVEYIHAAPWSDSKMPVRGAFRYSIEGLKVGDKVRIEGKRLTKGVVIELYANGNFEEFPLISQRYIIPPRKRYDIRDFDAKRKQHRDNHKDYTVKVDDSQDLDQYINWSGGTGTYQVYNQGVNRWNRRSSYRSLAGEQVQQDTSVTVRPRAGLEQPDADVIARLLNDLGIQ